VRYVLIISARGQIILNIRPALRKILYRTPTSAALVLGVRVRPERQILKLHSRAVVFLSRVSAFISEILARVENLPGRVAFPNC
jgi:hypothetical protein